MKKSETEKKATDYLEVERLVRKSKLTQADVDRLARKVNEKMGKRAEEMLDEIRRRKIK